MKILIHRTSGHIHVLLDPVLEGVDVRRSARGHSDFIQTHPAS